MKPKPSVMRKSGQEDMQWTIDMHRFQEEVKSVVWVYFFYEKYFTESVSPCSILSKVFCHARFVAGRKKTLVIPFVNVKLPMKPIRC